MPYFAVHYICIDQRTRQCVKRATDTVQCDTPDAARAMIRHQNKRDIVNIQKVKRVDKHGREVVVSWGLGASPP